MPAVIQTVYFWNSVFLMLCVPIDDACSAKFLKLALGEDCSWAVDLAFQCYCGCTGHPLILPPPFWNSFLNETLYTSCQYREYIILQKKKKKEKQFCKKKLPMSNLIKAVCVAMLIGGSCMCIIWKAGGITVHLHVESSSGEGKATPAIVLNILTQQTT